MRHETWVLSEPRTLHTTIMADSTDKAPDFLKGLDATDTPIHTVHVSIMAGNVHIETHDNDDVELDVHDITGRPLVAALVGGQFRVSYDYAGVEGIVDRVRSINDKDCANITLRIPRTAAIKVSAVRAHVNIDHSTAAVSVTTVDSNITLSYLTGALTASTVAGNITATHHTGAIKANTVSGDIDVAGELGRVTLITATGNVTVRVGTAASRISVRTVSSRVLVQGPTEVGIDLEARTVTGKVCVDGVIVADRKGPTKYEQVQPGASAFVTIKTVAGDITVNHDLLP